jgi:signal transduction histidine kinase/ligand-binding sensor domain-containing protein
MLQKKVLLLLCYCFMALEIFSQIPSFKFKHLSVNEGLSNQSVECVIEDRKGFLWVGTQDGLNRYDGYEFVQYKYRFDDSTSVPGNFILSLVEDNEGNIWIGTKQKGLAKYDYKLNNFKRYPSPTKVNGSNIHSLYKDLKGNIWVGTANGLLRYDRGTDDFIKYKIEENSSEDDIVYCFDELQDSTILVGTYTGGLYQLNKKTGKFENFEYFKNGELQAMRIDTRSIVAIKNTIWFANLSDGLFRYDLETKKLDNYNACDKSGMPNNEVKDILQDSKGNIWIGTIEGAAIYDSAKDKFIVFKNDNVNKYSISSNSIFKIFEDSQNNIWFCTYFTGLDYISYNSLSFQQFSSTQNGLSSDFVSSFCEDENHQIWVGTGNGIDMFNESNKAITTYIPNFPGGNSCNLVVADKKGKLYTAGYGTGVKEFDLKTKKFKDISSIDNQLNKLQTLKIKGIAIDGNGNLWIAGHDWDGIHIYDPKKKEYFHKLKPGNFDEKIFSIDYAVGFLTDHKGRVWIAAYTGLFMYDGRYHAFPHEDKNRNTPNSDYIISLFEDKQKNIWVGNLNGLDCITEVSDTFKFTRYNEIYNIPSNIKGILQDAHDKLWISSNDGIIKFNPLTGEQVKYDVYNGLQGDSFNEKSAFQSSSGNMYFGGFNGFNCFQPDSISINNKKPNVYITGFHILNSVQSIGVEGSPLSQSIIETKKITLNPNQKVFSFDYVAINYAGSKNNKYAYKLEGFDQDWQYVKDQRKATYTNLNPGTYTFKVIACNNDGLWNEEGRSIEIEILPHWYETLLFKLLFIFFLALTIILIVYNRINRIKKQNEALENKVALRTNELTLANKELREHQAKLAATYAQLEERQEEISKQNIELAKHRDHLELLIEERTAELKLAKEKAEESDRLKSAFLANMSHEIRTPMNAIIGFSSLLKIEDISEDDKLKFLDIIINNSESLLVIINDILQISMIEAHQISIRNSVFDVVPILCELETSYLNKNTDKFRVSFMNSNPPQSFILNSDIVRFRQVVSNLINNAIKFTKVGYVQFGFIVRENDIVFYVEDTGIGIKEKDQEKVFNHFYKIEDNPSTLYGGSGLGLSICQNLVELMDGRIWLESEPDKGSTFYFSLPYDANIQ